jgi:hypothetical protein
MSVVLPPPKPVFASPISRTSVQKQLLDNLTAALDRQASQRRLYRPSHDIVDVGLRQEMNDTDWLGFERCKISRATANIRKKGTMTAEIAKLDRTFSTVATEARSRYAIEQLRHSYATHKTNADRRLNNARGRVLPRVLRPAGPDISEPRTEPALKLYRTTIPVTEPHVRAMCYWFAMHVIGRLANVEAARPGADGSSHEEWSMGAVIDRSAKRMSGGNNFEPEWTTSARVTTPQVPHRVFDRIPEDPYGVLRAHDGRRPNSHFVNMLVTIVYEKEITIEAIIAAAWFIDGISVHDVDGAGHKLRDALLATNAGESFGVERRLAMAGFYLAEMSISDNYWPLEAWALSCMIPPPQASVIEREALTWLQHSIIIPPKAWLDHCRQVYSNVSRLRIPDADINWALLEVCHKLVSTARGIVDANDLADKKWAATRTKIEALPCFDDVKAYRADTSCMDEDDDEYEEFDGAGAFPQPVFKAHEVMPPSPALSEDEFFEPYDGAGHFPMPAVGKIVHPTAVARSPVEYERVRPVLNRLETIADMVSTAPYHFKPFSSEFSPNTPIWRSTVTFRPIAAA